MLGLDQEREELGRKHVSYRYGDPSFKYVCLFVCMYLQYSKSLVHKDSNLTCLIVRKLLPPKVGSRHNLQLSSKPHVAKTGSPAPLLFSTTGCVPVDPHVAANRFYRPLSFLSKPELQTGSIGPSPISPSRICANLPICGPGRRSTQLLTNQTHSTHPASQSEIIWVAKAMPTWSGLFICQYCIVSSL